MRGLMVLALVAVVGCGDDDVSPDASSPDAPACTADRDCDDGMFCNGPERCVDGACMDGAPPCEEPGACEEATGTCGGECPDADGDGHEDQRCGGTDCDDADPLRYPGNEEVCDPDDRDEDCDPRTFGFRDADGDAAPDARCCNGDVCGTDCDDDRPDVQPMGAELCDERDNDCDGAVDEERVFVEWYPDEDGDLFGDGDVEPIVECNPVPGRVSNPDDCDDTREDVHPGATERCDDVDQDCDEIVDEGAILTFYRDADADGFGTDDDTRMGCAEDRPDGYVLEGGDCLDAVEPSSMFLPEEFHPGADEICDTWINNCTNWPADATEPPARMEEDPDGDGVASAESCVVGRHPIDCVGTNPDVYPGQFRFFERAHCPRGGAACLTMSGRWVCGVPASETDPGCTFAPEPVTDASFDYDCDGEEEPEARLAPDACDSCGFGVCQERLTRRSNGPTWPEMMDPPACGAPVAWRTCTGSCGSCSQMRESAGTSGHFMPCR